MSQRKEKYYRHMMRQYEGIATDVDRLNNRIEVMQRDLERERNGRRENARELRRIHRQVCYVTQNQKKGTQDYRRPWIGTAVIAAVMAWFEKHDCTAVRNNQADSLDVEEQ